VSRADCVKADYDTLSCKSEPDGSPRPSGKRHIHIDH